jgi:hypothetical protein
MLPAQDFLPYDRPIAVSKIGRTSPQTSFTGGTLARINLFRVAKAKKVKKSLGFKDSNLKKYDYRAHFDPQ